MSYSLVYCLNIYHGNQILDPWCLLISKVDISPVFMNVILMLTLQV